MKKQENREPESSGKQRDALREARRPVIIAAVAGAFFLIIALIAQRNTTAFPFFFGFTVVALIFWLAVAALILRKINHKIINTDSSLLYDGDDKAISDSINFSRSRSKIVRAGQANVLIPGIVIFCSLVYFAGRDLGYSFYYIMFAETVVFLLLGFLYMSAVSRITKRDCDIIFECPLYEVKISITDIRKIYYFKQKLNGQISFIVMRKNKLLPRIFTAIIVSFDKRWIDEAKEAVEEFLHDPDCSGDG